MNTVTTVMDSTIKTTDSAPLAPLQLIPGYTTSSSPTVMEPPTLKRCQHVDVTSEWLEMRDDNLTAHLSPTPSAPEDMNSPRWFRAKAIGDYTSAYRTHEAAAKKVSATQKKVLVDGEDRSLLAVAYDQYNASTKELDAAEKEWLAFDNKV
jgi:hypothetical protein